MDWFNQNELRRYPLREDSAATPVSGEFPLDGLICDLSMVVPVAYRDSVCLRQFAITDRMVSLSLAAMSTNVGLAVGTWPRPVEAYKPYPLTPLAAGVSGYVVFGALAVDIAAAAGLFSPADPLLVDQHAVLAIESGLVPRISKYGGSTAFLTGLVRLLPGDNIMLSVSGQTISIGLIPSVRSELVGPCDQQGAFDGCGGVPVRSINGVPGDANGKITLEVN